MSDYTMPVKAIKRIMSDEIARAYDDMLGKVYTDLQKEMIRAGQREMTRTLDAITDYKALDYFCGLYYRMSLFEWIQSL